MLATWIGQGIKTARKTMEDAEGVRKLAEQFGGKKDLLLWTQGRYDLVGVMDIPSDEALAVLALQIGASGATRTETLRGFTADEMSGILERLG
ncbi:MAG TPA: GYD domain-containing protein [Thermomicrobiales bacterium]|nr:GYD domain-containing protein [Thermomicrobiales bacterium]